MSLGPVFPVRQNISSLVPQFFLGAAYANAIADNMVNVADVLLLSNGQRVHNGTYRWVNHGLVVGKWYYLDQITAGGITQVKPVTGIVQQLLFVLDNKTVLVDIEEAYSADVSSVQVEVGIPTFQMDGRVLSPTITLPDSTQSLGEAYKIVDSTNEIIFQTVNGEPIIGDLDHKNEGSVLFAIPSSQKVLGTIVNIIEQPENAPNSVDWFVSSNVMLRRGNNGGLYNVASGQTSWSGGNATGTLWRNDTNTTPTGFSNAFDGQIGDFILDPAYDNTYITDVVTGIEYGPFTFTLWQAGGGGGFAVTDGTTSPDVINSAWELVDVRPEVRTGNTTSARQRELFSVSTVLNVAGDFTPGQGGNTGLSLTKFNNGSGGQSNVGNNTDQDFFFDDVLLSRIVLRTWNDVSLGDTDIRLTLSFNGFNPQSVTQTISQTGGGGSISTNFDFVAGTFNQVKLEILSNRWRALGVSHQLVAPTVSNPNNTFATGGYIGAHDVLHLVNPDNTLPMFVDGVENDPNFEVLALFSTTITRLQGKWYKTMQS